MMIHLVVVHICAQKLRDFCLVAYLSCEQIIGELNLRFICTLVSSRWPGATKWKNTTAPLMIWLGLLVH